MSAAEIKEDLHRLIDTLDERFLRAVHSMVRAYQAEADEIVGYRIPGGEPVRADDFLEEIEEIEAEIERGECTTLEDLELFLR